MALRDIAAVAAAQATGDAADKPTANGASGANSLPASPPAVVPPAVDEGPSPEVIAYEEATGEGDPPIVPVVVAWNRVMRDVRAVAKLDKVDQGPARFAYRGVDRAFEAFGPACRRHGVLVIPEKVDVTYAPTTTSAGKHARECVVVVTYKIYGPGGDFISAQAAGESIDTSDKSVPKAQAVAFRTLLYHAGLVPTRDTDPDAVHIERGESPLRTAASYRDEALNPRTSVARLRQIHHELRAANRLGEVVENETGDDEPIGNLITRIGKERAGQ